MSFAQGTPSVNTLINSSNCIVLGNTSSGTALTVQQLGAGAVMNVATSTGSSALFVSSTGQVGIGSTSPRCTLDVVGSGITEGIYAKRFYLAGPGDNTDSSGNLNDGGPWYGLGYSVDTGLTSYIQLASYYGLALKTGGSSILMIGGNVGIGTTNPYVLLTAVGSCTFGPGAGTQTAAYHAGMVNIIGGGTRALLRIENNGSVGSPGIIFGEGGVFTEDTVPTIKKVQGTNNLAIMCGGNVGIGTTNPSLPLDVLGGVKVNNSNQTTALSIQPDGSDYYGSIIGKSITWDGTYYNIYSDGSNRGGAAIQMQWRNIAFYTYGVSPAATNAQLTPTQFNAYQRMTITAGGNVGIGTASPGYTLQVNGSIGMVGGTSIPLTLPATGSQTSYSITLASSGTWYTVISDARINATITGAIGVADLTSTIFIATLIATGGASASMTLVTGNAANIRVSGTALQFLANGSSYGLNCCFTLIRHS